MSNYGDELKDEQSTTSRLATVILSLRGFWMLAMMEELVVGCWHEELEAAHCRCS